MQRPLHMLLFLGVFALLLVLAHGYLWWRIGFYFHLSGSQKKALAIGLFVLGSCALVSLPLVRALPQEAASAVAWALFPWMGILLLAVLAFAATDFVWLCTRFLPPDPAFDSGRRRALQGFFGVAALGFTGTTAAFSFWNGLRKAAVKNVVVTLERLPRSLDGLRIAQITDLHLWRMIDGPRLHDIVERVNALKPDLIAVTGDLVDGRVEDLGPHIAAIGELKAPLGVYFVTGNHEYYSGVDPWCAFLARQGVRVLRNERVTLSRSGSPDRFYLAGVDDWSARALPAGGPHMAKALDGRDPGRCLLLLAHQPAHIEEAAAYGVDLQLSGHTHGGQIWPFNLLVYLAQPYLKGLHRHRETRTQIYVSEGTGFWGPPMRFGTKAEITHITLRAKA